MDSDHCWTSNWRKFIMNTSLLICLAWVVQMRWTCPRRCKTLQMGTQFHNNYSLTRLKPVPFLSFERRECIKLTEIFSVLPNNLSQNC